MAASHTQIHRSRSLKLNLFHALQSVVIVFLVWAIDKAVTYSNTQFTGQGPIRTPEAIDIPSIPDCRENLFLLVRIQGAGGGGEGAWTGNPSTVVAWQLEHTTNIIVSSHPQSSHLVHMSLAPLNSPRTYLLRACATDIASRPFLQRDRPCHAFIFTPSGDPLVESLVDSMLRNNTPPMDRGDVLGMNNMAEVSVPPS